MFPPGWNGSFGPKYGEYNRTLQVNTFDGYTVFSLKGKENNVEIHSDVSDEVVTQENVEE